MNHLQGRVHKYGNNISTDLIIASRHLTKFLSPKELGEYALEPIDPQFTKRVKKGDILVAGKNFGCGSSREEAVVALAESGLVAVVAESFGRTFFRNCINSGALLPVECEGILEIVENGESIKIDLVNKKVINLESNISRQLASTPEFIEKIINSGGLLKYLANQQYK